MPLFIFVVLSRSLFQSDLKQKMLFINSLFSPLGNKLVSSLVPLRSRSHTALFFSVFNYNDLYVKNASFLFLLAVSGVVDNDDDDNDDDDNNNSND